MENNRQIEQVAAEWIIRREGEEWTTEEETRLREWLNSSMAHRAAYWRLEAAWEETLRLQALGAGKRRSSVPRPGAWQVSPFFERRQDQPQPQARPARAQFLALAVSLLVAVGIGTFIFYDASSGEHYATSVGVMSSIPLDDGSNVTLNTASKIRVELSERQRLVRLEDGEAFFDVVKEVARPFVVEAGSRRITAVGTQFSVRRKDDDVQVVVTEGKVRIDPALRSGARRPSASAGMLLAAGAMAHASEREFAVQERTPSEAEETLSWRTGYLTFKAVPLKEAIAEFNRYTSRKIVMADEVAAFHVTGRFRATNAEAFLRVLHRGFGIEAHKAGDSIVLTDGRAGPP